MNPPLTYRSNSTSTNIGGYRYFFNGQEGDNEVLGELANFGYEFRQYDSRLGRWWSVDPKWNEYPSVSPYVFCNDSPLKYVDSKGGMPIAAIFEGICAFMVSAGLDFLSNWLIKDQDFSTAFQNVSWMTAAIDGGTTFLMSIFVNGTGSARYMTKIANSKVAHVALETLNNMLSNVSSQIESGKSFKEINLTEEFLYASFSTLVGNGMGKKADELLQKVQSSNEKLYNKCMTKLRHIKAQKDDLRLQRDSHKIKIAKQTVIKSSIEYVEEETKNNAATGAATTITRTTVDYLKDELEQ